MIEMKSLLIYSSELQSSFCTRNHNKGDYDFNDAVHRKSYIVKKSDMKWVNNKDFRRGLGGKVVLEIK